MPLITLLELYALRLNENRQADKEIVLVFNDTATVVGPTIAVAMAPNGDLYFGGYRIFKLTVFKFTGTYPTIILDTSGIV